MLYFHWLFNYEGNLFLLLFVCQLASLKHEIKPCGLRTERIMEESNHSNYEFVADF